MKPSDPRPLPAGAVGEPSSVATVQAGAVEWLTPGRCLADAVRARPEVRLVLERYAPDRYTAFVVLDRDPEPLLDAIFDVEQELHRRFPKLPFDLRVMTPGPQWDEHALRSGTRVIFERSGRERE